MAAMAASSAEAEKAVVTALVTVQPSSRTRSLQKNGLPSAQSPFASRALTPRARQRSRAFTPIASMRLLKAP